MPPAGDKNQFSNTKLNPSNLSQAMGKPQIGRRDDPGPDDPGVRRRNIAVGIALGALIVVIFFIIMVILGQTNPYPA